MAHCCRYFPPIIDVVTSLGKAVGMHMGDTTMIFSFYE